MSGALRITRLDSAQSDFGARLHALARASGAVSARVEEVVRGIIAEVRARGDEALVELTNRLDRRVVKSATELELPGARLRAALDALDAPLREALEFAAARIRAYHERQRQASWSYTEDDGTVLGQQVTPLDRVGVYVPGGKAAYPSSVLMNVVPASVAGVGEIVMVVPAPDGELSELVLAAAALAGVTRVFTIGGAQAVAALAAGTATVPAVDKIVGPGNSYVAAAKRVVFGEVGIDMVAGPSEIVVVCDGGTRADWIAMDLFSQAEHDEEARAVLLSPDAGFLDRVLVEFERLLPDMQRRDIIAASLRDHGALIHTRDLAEAVAIVNELAPEHLELSVAEPRSLLGAVRHAGAVFLGRHTPEAFGDYCAGPNHVLPTARTARFSSPLGVYDFQKRTSVIDCSAAGARRLAGPAAMLARGEHLHAHARSAELRLQDDTGG